MHGVNINVKFRVKGLKYMSEYKMSIKLSVLNCVLPDTAHERCVLPDTAHERCVLPDTAHERCTRNRNTREVAN